MEEKPPALDVLRRSVTAMCAYGVIAKLASYLYAVTARWFYFWPANAVLIVIAATFAS